MKNTWTIAFLSITLFSCGGSGGDSDSGSTTKTSKEDLTKNLSNTYWKKECVPYYNSSSGSSTIAWYVDIRLSIDGSLKSTYKTKFFRPTDTECNSFMFDTLEVSKFEITKKIISEESIAAYGLNETFVYSSESNEPAPKYTLIYVDSERLYFGKNSGSNLGETSETRHSSISLGDYFTQVVN